MRTRKYRAWNGESMEYGGFAIHATAGKVLVDAPGITKVTEDSPVMEFTSGHDKNGVEIFKDDIVTAYIGNNMYQNFTVEWNPDNYGFGFWLKSIGPQKCYPYHNHAYDSLNRQWGKDIEVIGNIWENPELTSTKKGGDQ